MRTIGIRELKANLSRVVRDVQAGEHYLVTDRGRVVAELRQPSATEPTSVSSADQATRRLAASGELRVAERPRVSYQRPSAVKAPEGAAQAWLDWVRGES